MNDESNMVGVVEDEKILPDDYPVYAGYLYVCDEKVMEANVSGTVATLKQDGYKEIRNCNIAVRNLWKYAIF